jgi:uncharacterized membrane protein
LGNASIVAFHRYATWLVSISWKRFFLLALLLMIMAAILESIPPFSWRISEVIEAPRQVPRSSQPPTPPREPVVKIEKPAPGTKTEGVDISIDERGIRITPRAASEPAGSDGQAVRITVPPGADTEEVRQAVREAEQGIREAIQEAREEARQAALEAAQDARDAAEEAHPTSLHTRIRVVKLGDFVTDLAALCIIASIVIKITYKGQLQARAAAAQATETAEAEQLKRQVVEARMAAMQAQVEPHFLFNTLASIDHLIETDPPRASRMQKSLIAPLPAMREGTVNGVRDLGQEIAVIEPYLEILKVRMEERLHTRIDVPEGLRSAEFPPMMVQGLVENAIKHGLEPKPAGGTLTVQAEIVHGQLQVTVSDTGVGFGQAGTAGTGTGLVNIRERLRLLYGDRARLEVGTADGGGTQARVTLPYKAHAPDAAPAAGPPSPAPPG